MINSLGLSARKNCKPAFLALFRKALYSTKISWGSKVFFLSLLDLPEKSEISLAKAARKLWSSPSQTSIWKKELVYRGFLSEAKTAAL
jgi:hypothetical protein